jgi:hypothetical protein
MLLAGIQAELGLDPIKTFGGDNFGKIIINLFDAPQLAAGCFICHDAK